MVRKNHNTGEYTTQQAADIVGDISPTRIRQIANTELVENVDYKKFGRTLVITEAGIERIRARNTKPGPQSKVNGGRRAA
jgi:hypothetical protein